MVPSNAYSLLLGKYIVVAIKQRYKVLGAQILVAEDYYTPTRILREFEEVTGKRRNTCSSMQRPTRASSPNR